MNSVNLNDHDAGDITPNTKYSIGADIEWVRSGILWISRFEVTVAQMRCFVDADGYENPHFWSTRGWAWKSKFGVSQPSFWMQMGYSDDHVPVTGVSHWEAEAFANFSGADLPTEAEWFDIASNGGRTLYPWGDDDNDISRDRANLSFFGQFRPTGLTPVNEFPYGRSSSGIWDLIGNVCEWCYLGSTPKLESDQQFGALRGGCSWHTPLAVNAESRDQVTLEVRDNQTGIRLVRRETTSSDCPTLPNRTTKQTVPDRKPIRRPSKPFRQEGIPVGMDERSWRLEVTGDITSPAAFTLSQLREYFPRTCRRGVFVCVCRWADINEVVGVRLADLLTAVRPIPSIESLYLRQLSIPGPSGRRYDAAIRLTDALRDDAILAYELDGSPLTPELGWPLRLFSFSFFGYKLVKCLARIHLSTAFHPGWWETTKNYCREGIVQPGTVTVIGDEPYRLDINQPGAVSLIE